MQYMLYFIFRRGGYMYRYLFYITTVAKCILLISIIRVHALYYIKYNINYFWNTFHISGDFKWGYDIRGAPMYWHYYFNQCIGDSQSPIDLYDDDVTRDSLYEPITFSEFDRTDGVTMTLRNSGQDSEWTFQLRYLAKITVKVW